MFSGASDPWTSWGLLGQSVGIRITFLRFSLRTQRAASRGLLQNPKFSPSNHFKSLQPFWGRVEWVELQSHRLVSNSCHRWISQEEAPIFCLWSVRIWRIRSCTSQPIWSVTGLAEIWRCLVWERLRSASKCEVITRYEEIIETNEANASDRRKWRVEVFRSWNDVYSLTGYACATNETPHEVSVSAKIGLLCFLLSAYCNVLSKD